MKRIITIVAFVIVIVALGIGGFFIWQYFSLSSNTAVPPVTGGGTTPPPTNAPPSAVNSAIKQLADVSVAGYAITGDKITAITADGQVIEITNTSAQILNSAKLNEPVLSVKASYDGTWLLEKFGDKNHPKFSLYNVAATTWTPITDFDMMDADWAADSNKLAYLGVPGINTDIGIMDVGKETKTGFLRSAIGVVALEDAQITWLNANEIIFNDKSSKYAVGSIWKYKIKEKTFIPLVYEKAGLFVRWNKTGSIGTVFMHDPKNNFYIVDSNGGLLVLNNPSLSNKCTFQESSLICAVPKNNIMQAALPDDYLKYLIYTNDDFYAINYVTGGQDIIFNTQDAQIDATDLSIFGSQLIFINRRDNRLYAINLP